MPRSLHSHSPHVPEVDFVQTTEVIVVHCAVIHTRPHGDGGGNGRDEHSLFASVSVLCGPDWLSVSIEGVPACQMALGGRVNPSSSFAIISSESGWSNNDQRDTSPSAASSQSSEGSYALLSAQIESQMVVKLYLSKDSPGIWEGSIVGPLFTQLSSSLPPDGTVLNVALGPSDMDWDCTYNASSGNTSPLSGSTRELQTPSIVSGLSSTELQNAIVEAFADLQAVRDEFTPTQHQPAPRPTRPHPSSLPSSSRTIRPSRDSDSDAGGSQASATILAARPPLAPLSTALAPPPSVELVFPDPLAELGLAEMAAEGDISSCSLDSNASPKKACNGRHLRSATVRTLSRTRRTSTAATASSASAEGKLRRRHRRRRIPASRVPSQGAKLSLGVGFSVVAMSAVAFLWWRRAVRTA